MVVLTLPELWGGNVTILLAAAVVVGFRFAGAWAFPLLTKVTPGVGVLWFAARREWRAMWLALACTAVVIAATALAAPHLWGEWTTLLAEQRGLEHGVGLGARPARAAAAGGRPRHRLGGAHRPRAGCCR